MPPVRGLVLLVLSAGAALVAGCSGGAGRTGGAGTTGAAGTGTPTICTFSQSSATSSKIPTVGIVTWSTTLPGVTSAQIDFGPTTKRASLYGPPTK